jgi:hypothetical protein
MQAAGTIGFIWLWGPCERGALTTFATCDVIISSKRHHVRTQSYYKPNIVRIIAQLTYMSTVASVYRKPPRRTKKNNPLRFTFVDIPIHPSIHQSSIISVYFTHFYVVFFFFIFLSYLFISFFFSQSNKLIAYLV